MRLFGAHFQKNIGVFTSKPGRVGTVLTPAPTLSSNRNVLQCLSILLLLSSGNRSVPRRIRKCERKCFLLEERKMSAAMRVCEIVVQL